jgi:putative membrane protein
MTFRIQEPPPLPDYLAKGLEGLPDAASSATQLAVYRTQLAVYRTYVSNLRSHLANERTHLAYLRTAISLIGFGITINRFAQWLLQSELKGSPLPLVDARHAGSFMVILGLLLLAWALFRFWVVSKDIENGRFVARDRAVFIASMGVLVIGGGSAVWLFFF